MNPVERTNLSQLEAPQQKQSRSLGITDLPKELLVRIFTNLASKNLSPIEKTCPEFKEISKIAFLEQKKQVQSFLKRSWGTEFTQDIEERSVNSKNFEEFKEVINSFYYSIYIKYFRASELFWKTKYEHTQLEDLSTIELLIEILRPFPVNPIMLLPDDFCSKLTLETVDTLVDKLLEKATLDTISDHLFYGFKCSIYPHSRKLLQYGHKRFSWAPQSQGFMQRASDRLKDDKKFILKLIEEWKPELKLQPQICLRYASDRLKNDKDVVLAAVRKNGFCLEYASASLKGDKEVVLAALQTNLPHFHFEKKQPDWWECPIKNEERARKIAFKRDYMTKLVPDALWSDPDIINLVTKKRP